MRGVEREPEQQQLRGPVEEGHQHGARSKGVHEAAGRAAVRRIAAEPAEGEPAAPTWTVRPGETLSSIADAALGDAGRWREILELNRDQLEDPNRIFPGQVLRLPGGAKPAPEPEAPAHAPPPRTYVVQRGDTLSEIAAKTMGPGASWRALWEANKDQVPNPNVIHAGMVLTIPGPGAVEPAPPPVVHHEPPKPPPQAPPSAAPTQPAPPAESDTFLYTVQPMDSLAWIAKSQLGDESRWREILELNRDQIANPSLIRPGMVLRLPGRAPQGPATTPTQPVQPAPPGGDGQIDPRQLGPDERVAYRIYQQHHGFLAEQAGKLGFEVEVAAAVLIAESSGSGYVGEKLKIRFEPGVFQNYTGRWVDDGHRNQSDEYDAFARARQIDEEAAYKSMSMGAAQIMGFNAESVGYKDAREMFDSFQASETRQLMGLFDFVGGRRVLVQAARQHDWATFALHYNGPGYRQNGYDTKLASYFEAYHRVLELLARR